MKFVQCTACDKWRSLYEGVDLESLVENWTCAMNDDQNYNNCDVPDEIIDDVNDELIESNRGCGSLVWAKYSTVDYWPCIICAEPHTKLWTKTHKGKREIVRIHVGFLGGSGYNWVFQNNIHNYFQWTPPNHPDKSTAAKAKSTWFRPNFTEARNLADELGEINDLEVRLVSSGYHVTLLEAPKQICKRSSGEKRERKDNPNEITDITPKPKKRKSDPVNIEHWHETMDFVVANSRNINIEIVVNDVINKHTAIESQNASENRVDNIDDQVVDSNLGLGSLVWALAPFGLGTHGYWPSIICQEPHTKLCHKTDGQGQKVRYHVGFLGGIGHNWVGENEMHDYLTWTPINHPDDSISAKAKLIWSGPKFTNARSWADELRKMNDFEERIEYSGFDVTNLETKIPLGMVEISNVNNKTTHKNNNKTTITQSEPKKIRRTMNSGNIDDIIAWISAKNEPIVNDVIDVHSNDVINTTIDAVINFALTVNMNDKKVVDAILTPNELMDFSLMRGEDEINRETVESNNTGKVVPLNMEHFKETMKYVVANSHNIVIDAFVNDVIKVNVNPHDVINATIDAVIARSLNAFEPLEENMSAMMIQFENAVNAKGHIYKDIHVNDVIDQHDNPETRGVSMKQGVNSTVTSETLEIHVNHGENGSKASDVIKVANTSQIVTEEGNVIGQLFNEERGQLPQDENEPPEEEKTPTSVTSFFKSAFKKLTFNM